MIQILNSQLNFFKMKCKYCQEETQTIYSFVIEPIRLDLLKFPNWKASPKCTVTRIKATCGKCGRYLKFVKQTPELINKINKRLDVGFII